MRLDTMTDSHNKTLNHVFPAAPADMAAAHHPAAAPPQSADHLALSNISHKHSEQHWDGRRETLRAWIMELVEGLFERLPYPGDLSVIGVRGRCHQRSGNGGLPLG